MKNSKAIIVVENRDALRVAASSARISTQQGTAMEIFGRSLGDERDLKLINKVLSSGHKSVIEHQTFGVAFDNVSVLVEQFVIEARLASYTVKSRRYVDFSSAGCVIPEGLGSELESLYSQTMSERFEDYEKLIKLGIPREDARFVLPYSLRSNFFMTLNARELIALICAMMKGRGSGFCELEGLGAQLKKQFDALYPGVIDTELAHCQEYAPPTFPTVFNAPCEAKGDAVLLSSTPLPHDLLEAAMAFSGRFEMLDGKRLHPENIRRLLTDARPRELELLNYVFRIKDISLACLTHFARHRIQSPLIPPVLSALAGGHYVMPESVRTVREAEQVYRAAFEAQTRSVLAARTLGISLQDASYYALSGHQLDILLSMNARELLHFMKLRTCSRAQWEIRGIAGRMLALLVKDMPELFGCYGASCRLGSCPEGKMSCGKPQPKAW